MVLKTGNKISLRHGKSKSPEYNSWCNMKARCYNEKNHRFYNWGGRGIKVCDEWLHSFEQFYADMGDRPTLLHSLDRIDGDKDYSKENCKWSTKKEQATNRPSWVNVITFNGKSQTITDWALELGIARKSLYERLEKWGIERALTTRKLR